MEVQRYGALNAAMQMKYATEYLRFLHGTTTYVLTVLNSHIGSLIVHGDTEPVLS